MMFANYATRHFLGKLKVIGNSLCLKLITKQTNSHVCLEVAFCISYRKMKEDGVRKHQNLKGQFAEKDSVSDVINLLI